MHAKQGFSINMISIKAIQCTWWSKSNSSCTLACINFCSFTASWKTNKATEFFIILFLMQITRYPSYLLSFKDLWFLNLFELYFLTLSVLLTAMSKQKTQTWASIYDMYIYYMYVVLFKCSIFNYESQYFQYTIFFFIKLMFLMKSEVPIKNSSVTDICINYKNSVLTKIVTKYYNKVCSDLLNIYISFNKLF